MKFFKNIFSSPHAYEQNLYICHAELVSASQKLKTKLFYQNKSAFTLAEVLITLVIIGVIAAITIPSLMHKKFEDEAVSKIIKNYSILSQAIQKYQLDNACTSHIGYCNLSESDVVNIMKPLNIIDKCSPCTNTDWLPASSKTIKGTTNSASNGSWGGVSKNAHTAYLLADGSTLVFYKESASNLHIWLDINGKRPPNYVGKDIFPIGLGIRYNNTFDKRFPTITPFLGDDSSLIDGMCLINSSNKMCDVDACTKNSCSPTAYVLKNKKLPPI